MKRMLVLFLMTSFSLQTFAERSVVTYKIIDEGGCPISNAVVRTTTSKHEFTLSWNSSIPKAKYHSRTDSAGFATCEFDCPQGNFDVMVFAEGFYHENKGPYWFRKDGGEFKKNREQIDITLRKIKHPVELIGTKLISEPLPQSSGVFYFDLEKGGWVLSGHNGKNADIKVSCISTTEGAMTTCTGVVEFVSGGAYKMKDIESSIFKTVYEADTNAVYQTAFPFSWMQNDNGSKGYRYDFPLSGEEYLVYRTRVVTNSVGKVVSANYGVIHGPMNILKYFCYAEGSFNPVQNDTNLEDIRMFRRYNAIKRHEEERSRKSWDIMGLFGK